MSNQDRPKGSDAEMSPSPDVLSAHLEGEAVLLDMDSKRYFRLNETASVIWRALEEGHDRAHIRETLKQQYDVGDAELDAAIASTMETFAQHKLAVKREDAR